jgi:glyoxylase-like metal-dependent hydrolase (beta-lactamase superfamily II)
MKRIILIAIALLICLSFGMAAYRREAVAPPQDVSQATIKAEKANGNVYMLTGAGGNIGVSAGADGILMIDDQFAPLSEKIRAALKELNPGKLKFVLNTHYHGDHTGGNVNFGTEAPIIAQTNVRKRLSTEQKVLGEAVKAAPPEALPVITFDDALSLYFNGEEIRVMHFPNGHTDGDSIIFFTKSNVVHMGDDFFAGKFPFIDLDSGGSVEGMTRNVRAVIAKLPADTKVIPGHGPLSTVADLKAYENMLTETTENVRGQMKAGKTLEQIRAAGLPAKWDSWGTGFIKTNIWIDTIYNSLSKK